MPRKKKVVKEDNPEVKKEVPKKENTKVIKTAEEFATFLIKRKKTIKVGARHSKEIKALLTDFLAR